MISKIVFKHPSGKEFDLTLEQAEELYNELKKLFNKDSQPVVVPFPYLEPYPYPQQPYYPNWPIITVSDTSNTGYGVKNA